MNIKKKIKKIIRILLRKPLVIKKQVKMKMKWIGNDYGGFAINEESLSSNPLVYSFGIGEDTSFDEEMINKYHAEVFAFDPTPKSIKWVSEKHFSTQFHFEPVGIADKDGTTKFYLPQNKDYVSGGMVYRKELCSDSIDVEMKRLNSIIEKNGHKKIDILKLDIEGSEYDVIPDVLKTDVEIKQICVEVHGRFFENGKAKNQELISALNTYGYYISYVSDSFEELTFIKLK